MASLPPFGRSKTCQAAARCRMYPQSLDKKSGSCYMESATAGTKSTIRFAIEHGQQAPSKFFMSGTGHARA